MLLISVKIHPSHFTPGSCLFQFMIVGWRQRTHNDRYVDFIKVNIEHCSTQYLMVKSIFSFDECVLRQKIPPSKKTFNLL